MVLETYKVQVAKMKGDPSIFFQIFIQPIVFALLFGYFYKLSSTQQTNLSTFIGVAQMASWQVLLYAGGIIVRHEFNREKTVFNTMLTHTSLFRLWALRLAICLTLTAPTYVLTLLIGWSVFGTHPTADQSGVTLFGIAFYFVTLYAIGLPLIFLLFLTIHGGRIIQTLSYPIFLLSGMIVSINYFPHWLRIIAYIFPVTWSTHWIQTNLLFERGDTLEIYGGLITSAVFFCLSAVIYRYIMRQIRRKGEFSL